MEAARQPDPDARRRGHASSVARKAAFNIAERWGLTDAQLATLLGGVPLATLRRWKRQLRQAGQVRTALTRDQLDRVSYLLGIHKALHILFPNAAQADGWVKRPNTAPGFDGRPALDIMLQGGMDDLRNVRRHLDAWRGW